MFYLIQLLRMLDKKQRKDFILIFNDLSYDELEIEPVDAMELVDELLIGHFGIEILEQKQLEHLTEAILKLQGNLKNRVRIFEQLYNF